MLTKLLLPSATGEGWDGGDACLIYATSNADNPPSQPSPMFMGEGDSKATTARALEKVAL